MQHARSSSPAPSDSSLGFSALAVAAPGASPLQADGKEANGPEAMNPPAQRAEGQPQDDHDADSDADNDSDGEGLSAEDLQASTVRRKELSRQRRAGKPKPDNVDRFEEGEAEENNHVGADGDADDGAFDKEAEGFAAPHDDEVFADPDEDSYRDSHSPIESEGVSAPIGTGGGVAASVIIAQLQQQLAHRDARIATLEDQVAPPTFVIPADAKATHEAIVEMLDNARDGLTDLIENIDGPESFGMLADPTFAPPAHVSRSNFESKQLKAQKAGTILKGQFKEVLCRLTNFCLPGAIELAKRNANNGALGMRADVTGRKRRRQLEDMEAVAGIKRRRLARA